MLNGDQGVVVSELVQNLQNAQLDAHSEHVCDASLAGADVNGIEDQTGKHCNLLLCL
jgi:hypothetical protein